MIFKLDENYSKEDLQKSYKKLVKKYHPDSNPKNQDWSHHKMTEINLAYEVCTEHLDIKSNYNQELREEPEKNNKKEQFFGHNQKYNKKSKRNKTDSEHISNVTINKLKILTNNFIKACERYFEYGLENRKLRNEGVRRFRYRETIRLFEINFSDCFTLEEYCVTDFDHRIVNLFTRFSGNFYQYALLKENEIPHHPLLNRHWQMMEEYLILSLKDYLVPHFIHNKKLHWNTSFTHCWNQLVYIKNRFPTIGDDKIFMVIYNLADSYRCMRKEETDRRISFFN